MALQHDERPYKPLGDLLLQAMGNGSTGTSLAKQLYVTPTAVHNWISGKRRPQPGTLGQIAAILRLCPEDCASLAGYDVDPHAYEKLLNAYRDRYATLLPRE